MRQQLVSVGRSSGTLFLDEAAEGRDAIATLGELRVAGEDEGARLIEAACTEARSAGAGRLLAPMNGDTWHTYRAVVESDGSAPFLMEPVSGPHDVAALRRAGLAPIERYLSARLELEEIEEGIAGTTLNGVSVERWDGTGADQMLRRAYDLSLQAFARNPLFRPISADAFLAIYRPLAPSLDPDFVLTARDAEGKAVGFLLGFPDLAQDDSPDTVILKSYASGVRGCGRLLADTFHATARRRGFHRAIHALMHESNRSQAASDRYRAHVFRRYALFARTLE